MLVVFHIYCVVVVVIVVVVVVVVVHDRNLDSLYLVATLCNCCFQKDELGEVEVLWNTRG